MALVLIKEEGSGKADANTYALVADCDAYHEARLYATSWTAATTANREKALVFATLLIDSQFQFNGKRVSSSQALQWPRRDCRDPDAVDGWVPSDVVPAAIVHATCEMARELLALDRTAPPPGEGVASIWTDTSGTTYNKRDARPVITHVAQAMLMKYGALIKSRSGSVRIVRG